MKTRLGKRLDLRSYLHRRAVYRRDYYANVANKACARRTAKTALIIGAVRRLIFAGEIRLSATLDILQEESQRNLADIGMKRGTRLRACYIVPNYV